MATETPKQGIAAVAFCVKWLQNQKDQIRNSFANNGEFQWQSSFDASRYSLLTNKDINGGVDYVQELKDWIDPSFNINFVVSDTKQLSITISII